MIKSPGDIIEKVKQVPPFQQKNIENGFSDQPISWRLSFKSVIPRKKSNVLLVSSRNPDGYGCVFFDVDVAKYPQFKIIHENEELFVTGVIEQVSGHEIILKDIRNISFLNQQQPISLFNGIDNSRSWYRLSVNQVISGVVVTVIGGWILYYLGWN